MISEFGIENNRSLGKLVMRNEAVVILGQWAQLHPGVS